jgi:hypothetical protein
MVTSLKNLKNQIDNRLSAGSLDALACCQLQNAQTILDNCIVTSVPNLDSLPPAVNNEGRFIYVEDINEYRFSNEAWSDDVTSGLCVYQNQLWAWGGNLCGILGDGTGTGRCSPVREISSSTDWCQVSVGFSHTTAIKNSGELWVWGLNSCGRLGDGTLTDRCSPVREFCSATDWCGVSGGGIHTAAIKTSGELWSWGSNVCGQLGDGTVTQRCSPIREISSSTDWCQVSAGCIHTAAIKTSGQIWSWGSNICGRLGDGTFALRLSPVREQCFATDWCQVSAGGGLTGTGQTSAIKAVKKGFLE